MIWPVEATVPRLVLLEERIGGVRRTLVMPVYNLYVGESEVVSALAAAQQKE